MFLMVSSFETHVFHRRFLSFVGHGQYFAPQPERANGSLRTKAACFSSTVKSREWIGEDLCARGGILPQTKYSTLRVREPWFLDDAATLHL